MLDKINSFEELVEFCEKVRSLYTFIAKNIDSIENYSIDRLNFINHYCSISLYTSSTAIGSYHNPELFETDIDFISTPMMYPSCAEYYVRADLGKFQSITYDTIDTHDYSSSSFSPEEYFQQSLVLGDDILPYYMFCSYCLKYIPFSFRFYPVASMNLHYFLLSEYPEYREHYESCRFEY